MSKSLPTVTSQIPRDLRTFVDRLRDIISSTGSGRLVSAQDLVDSGVATLDARGNLLPTVTDTTVYPAPATPTNVQASAAIQNIIVTWDAPVYPHHAYAEVWGADTNNIGAAVLLGQAPGAVYVDSIGPSRTRYYWVRFVNTQFTVGEFNAVGGTSATTGADLAYTMDLLSAAYGDTSEAPFFQLSTTQTINGVDIPAGTYMKAGFIYDGVITNAKIANAAIDSAKVDSLSAGKITSGYISADRIQAGTVTADKLGAGRITATDVITIGGDGASAPLVLSASGEVISNGTGGNKARLWSGDVEIYKDVPNVGSVVYKALTRAEFGQATNNTTVTIPGYFKNQPKVIVSPADLQLYSTTYSNQNQSIQCQAQNIAETTTGSMVWQFKPVATLSLAANTGNTVINQASGAQTGAWTSSSYTTPANTSSITPSVYLASNRGNGSNQYYYRSVRWRVEYWNGSSWVAGSFTTINLAADTAANVTSTAAFAFPSSGAWTFRIYCEAYDTNGTVFGSVSYNYASGTATAAGPAALQNYQLGTYNTSLTVSGYSPPAGYSVYSVDYAVDWYWSRNGTNGSVTVAGTIVKQSYTTGTSGSGTRTWNSGSLSSTISLSMQITALGGGFGGENLYSQISNARATIYSRQLITNSTTANNNFQLNSYAYALTTAQVLATGSLNWIALGE